MARIIGGVGTTHVPSIGNAIAGHKQNDPYLSPFFRGFDAVVSADEQRAFGLEPKASLPDVLDGAVSFDPHLGTSVHHHLGHGGIGEPSFETSER